MFGRSNSAPPRFSTGAGPAAEFWVTPDESRHRIVDGYHEACEFSDATINELTLETVGHVPWWGDAPITLHHVMVHVTVDTQRHAGHADIIRELIDGAVGLMRGADNLHIRDAEERRRFRDQVEVAAAQFR